MKFEFSGALFLFSLVFFAVLVIVFWEYSIDDAFITFRYAEHLVNGHGLTFNVSDKPVEGYSNFLWLLILSAAYSLGLPTYLTAKVLGVIFFVLTAFVWKKIEGPSYLTQSVSTAALFLLCPVTALWAVSGLELGLHAFLIAMAIYLYLQKSKISWLVLALLVISRPEGAIIAIALLLTGWVTRAKQDNSPSAFYFGGVLVVVAAVAGLIIFRMIVFGYPMPNTFYAKSQSAYPGLWELGKFAFYMFPLLMLYMFALYRMIRFKEYTRSDFLFAVIFMVQAAVSAKAAAVMNLHFRYLISFLPFFLAVTLGAFKIVLPAWKKVALAAVLIAIISPAYSVIQTLKQEERILAAQEDLLAKLNEMPGDIRISITDAGRIPYYSGKYFYDIWGLTSEEIAHRGFNPLREYIRFPDLFIFVGHIAKERLFLRFGLEELIYQNRAFKECYPFIGAGLPSGADISQPGYYYLAFAKNQRAVDSLLQTAGEKYLIGR